MSTGKLQSVRKTVEIDAPGLELTKDEVLGAHAKYMLRFLDTKFLTQPKVEYTAYFQDTKVPMNTVT